MTEPSHLVITDLVKQFAGGVLAVDHVSLTIREGQFATLLGPSGCGKTTTLNCVAGLEQPDGGRIAVGEMVLTDVGRRLVLPPERRNLGMVFQSYALWPHMTVYDNLAFGLRLKKVPATEQRRRIAEALELVGLSGLERRYPFQMSGGQQQRVALARAVVAQPRVLLLDEPLSNLDAKVREQARFWLREFQQRLGITTVYVTHDQAEALAISDMVAVMSRGKLLQYAPPHEIYEQPASTFVAEFIGQTSFLRGVVVGTRDGRVTTRLESGAQVTASADRAWSEGAPVVLAVRAERVRLGDDAADGEHGENTIAAKIQSRVYIGSTYQYLLSTPDGLLRVEAPRDVSGPEVRVYLPPEGIVVLPDDAAAPVTTGDAIPAPV
jgi:iron(III) transport system ATP-binding protein